MKSVRNEGLGHKYFGTGLSRGINNMKPQSPALPTGIRAMPSGVGTSYDPVHASSVIFIVLYEQTGFV